MSTIRMIINDTEINLNAGTYQEFPRVVETRNETEAGTTHRDIVRTGIGHVNVSMTADETEKAFFDACVNAPMLDVQYWSESSAAMITRSMFLDPDSYSADLIIESSGHRFYTVSFTLEEF